MPASFDLTLCGSRRLRPTRRSAGWRAAWQAALLIASVQPALADEAPSAQPKQASSPATVAVVDSLGRTTPVGTVAGLTSAVRREDFLAAEGYLQLTRAQRPAAQALAHDLAALVERYFTQPVNALSALPEGRLDDGLPPDRDRLVLSIDGKSVDLLLVRINGEQGRPIWLFSSDTLAEVPSLRSALHPTWMQRVMPAALSDRALFGIPLTQWIAFAASIVLPLAVLGLLGRVAVLVARGTVHDANRRTLLDAWRRGLASPVLLTGTLVLHLACLPFLGFPLGFRLVYGRIGIALLVVVLAWLTWRLLTLSADQAELAAQRRGQTGTRSLMLLGERIVKVLIVVLAILTVLAIAGVDTTTALAGLGIGGIAVALGAQKSVENLLGGVFLLTDKALAVGDMCRVSDRTGWIEDITLRSVRVRTVEQTLLSIPAGVLAQASIENFATRNKMPLQTKLRLQYGTTGEQLRQILSGVQDLLDRHPKLEPGSGRIRLIDFGAQAVELELYASIPTADGLQFLDVREEVLLHIVDIVEKSEASFQGAVTQLVKG
jgi:MscS family membrane protein